MRPLVDWFRSSDDEILKFLGDYRELAFTPAVIEHNLNQRYEISKPTIQRELDRMKAAGMVKRLEERGFYQITELGIRYVEGEMGAEELDALDPERDEE